MPQGIYRSHNTWSRSSIETKIWSSGLNHCEVDARLELALSLTPLTKENNFKKSGTLERADRNWIQTGQSHVSISFRDLKSKNRRHR